MKRASCVSGSVPSRRIEVVTFAVRVLRSIVPVDAYSFSLHLSGPSSFAVI